MSAAVAIGGGATGASVDWPAASGRPCCQVGGGCWAAAEYAASRLPSIPASSSARRVVRVVIVILPHAEALPFAKAAARCGPRSRPRRALRRGQSPPFLQCLRVHSFCRGQLALGNEYPLRRFASPDRRGELELQRLRAALVQRANHVFATLFMALPRQVVSCGATSTTPELPPRPPLDLRDPESRVAGAWRRRRRGRSCSAVDTSS